LEIIPGSLPLHSVCAPIIAPAFTPITVNEVELPDDIAFEQVAAPELDERLVIVIVVEPPFASTPVLKDPVPAVLTVKVEVKPVPEFAPERL
jgi:hypothetical protein